MLLFAAEAGMEIWAWSDVDPREPRQGRAIADLQPKESWCPFRSVRMRLTPLLEAHRVELTVKARVAGVAALPAAYELRVGEGYAAPEEQFRDLVQPFRRCTSAVGRLPVPAPPLEARGLPIPATPHPRPSADLPTHRTAGDTGEREPPP